MDYLKLPLSKIFMSQHFPWMKTTITCKFTDHFFQLRHFFTSIVSFSGQKFQTLFRVGRLSLQYSSDNDIACRADWPPLFDLSKRKKGDKGIEGRVSKQNLFKGCYQGQNFTVLAPPFWNSFRRPWFEGVSFKKYIFKILT